MHAVYIHRYCVRVCVCECASVCDATLMPVILRHRAPSSVQQSGLSHLHFDLDGGVTCRSQTTRHSGTAINQRRRWEHDVSIACSVM